MGEDAKDGLAVALSVIVTDDTIEELVALVKDERNGDSRLLLLTGLDRSRHPIAQKALESLTTHPYLGGEAKRALRRHPRHAR